jgi:hypothetical protein
LEPNRYFADDWYYNWDYVRPAPDFRPSFAPPMHQSIFTDAFTGLMYRWFSGAGDDRPGDMTWLFGHLDLTAWIALRLTDLLQCFI